MGMTAETQAAEAVDFCKEHGIPFQECSAEELPEIVSRLKRIDPGLGLSAEEFSWAMRQAFKNRYTLAFSKKELGLCSKVTFDIELKDPG